MDRESPGLCSVCKEEDENVRAVAVCPECPASFCDNCLHLHNRMPISKNHEVERITDKNGSNEELNCPLHPTRTQTLYCRPCKMTACVDCQRETHSTCEPVVEIQQLLPEMKSKLQILLQNLEKELHFKRKRLERLKSHRRVVLEISSQTESSIQETSDMFVNMIRAKECDLLGKLTSINVNRPGVQAKVDLYEEMTGSVDKSRNVDVLLPETPKSVHHQTPMQSTSGTGEDYVEASSPVDETGAQYLNANSNEIDKTRQTDPSKTSTSNPIDAQQTSASAISSESKEEGYEDLSSPEYSLAMATEYDQLNTEITICNTVLNCNIEDIAAASENLNLGQVDAIPLGVADLSSTPHLITTLDTKTATDTHSHYLKDVLVLTVDGIQTVVVSYEDSWYIKSFWTKYRREESSAVHMKKERPWAITAAEDNRVFATLPSEAEIVEIMVYPQLRLRNSFSTMKSYYGITYLGDSKLAACVRNNVSMEVSFSSVDILDLQGKVLKSILVNSINSPDYVCTTREGNIVMSDQCKKNVVCVSPDGPLLYSSPVREPSGVTATYAGYILCADKETQSVIQLSDIGEQERTLLTEENDIGCVNGLWYKDVDATLYVATGMYVRVYSFL